MALRYPSLLISALIAIVLSLALYGNSRHAWTKPPPPFPALAPEASFGLVEDTSSTVFQNPDPRYRNAVYENKGPYVWFGSFVGGDAFMGKLVGASFPIEAKRTAIPILGYPHSAETRLDLEIFSRDGTTATTLTFAGKNPGEEPGFWLVDTEKWIGLSAKLHLTDKSTVARGWLAIARPFAAEETGVDWIYRVPRNYGWHLVQVVTVVIVLFLPGVALRRSCQRFPSHPAFLPLPGLGLMASLGLLTWLGWIRMNPALLGSAVLSLSILGTIAYAWFARKSSRQFTRDETRLLLVYAAICLSALSFGIMPLEVAEEMWSRGPLQSRMIASPPDHSIPYTTAVYMNELRTNGAASSEKKFDEFWSIASRGPLVPFVLVGFFGVFNAHPALGAWPDLSAWPLDPTNIALARTVGIVTNAMLVLGVALLCRQLSPQRWKWALLWVSLAPVTLINVDFLWPKLFAAYFLMLALTGIVTQRHLVWSALACVFAYYAHPVGALFTPTVVIYLLFLRARGSLLSKEWLGSTIKIGLRFSAYWFLIALPWLIFKWQLGQNDVFARYPLGDGNGIALAESFRSWTQARLSNFWLTFVPGAFYLSDHMTSWLETPISDLLRWAITYAKTLPGNVGNLAYFVCVASLFKRATPLPWFRSVLLLLTSLLILLFWGFSRDGLGRNCLEPLSILFIVFAALSGPLNQRLWMSFIIIAALESLSVRIIGVIGATRFSWAEISIESSVLFAISTLAALSPLALIHPSRTAHDSK